MEIMHKSSPHKIFIILSYNNFKQLVISLLLFGSPEPKAQVSFSDHNSSFVRRRCHHCCCCVLLLFISSSRTTESISTKLNQTRHKASLGKGDSIWSNEGPCPFRRGDNYEIKKIH